MEVLETGVLSGFRGVAGSDFFGGPQVKSFEQEWSDFVGSNHAVGFNSLTSGLFAMVGAAGVGPGDEVIVSPYTMSASATCALAYGAIPVFADIDPQTYCLDPDSIRRRISERTKAIVVVHLFGFPAPMDDIMALAREHDLVVIEDAAQAPGGLYRGQHVGTIGHMGGFSLNYHKTIHSGEGGIIVTNDDNLAIRLQLIRNHGEVVVDEMDIQEIGNLFGGNTRMTEIQAAIGRQQLRKLDFLTKTRINLARVLDEGLEDVPGITPQIVNPEDRHVYYFYPMCFDEEIWELSRDTFVRASQAEGIEMRQGYVRPIYWEPLYQRRVAFAGGNFPFDLIDPMPEYPRGLCPMTEEAHESSLIFGKFCRWPLTSDHALQVLEVVRKVWDHRGELRNIKF